jgi:hypothetical protein
MTMTKARRKKMAVERRVTIENASDNPGNVSLATLLSAALGDTIDVSQMSCGAVTAAHTGITATATSAAIDKQKYSGLFTQFLLTAGAGTWTISLTGCPTEGGTYVTLYDKDNVALSVSGLTASAGWTWPVVGAPYVKVVATEDSDGATVSVNVVPIV